MRDCTTNSNATDPTLPPGNTLGGKLRELRGPPRLSRKAPIGLTNEHVSDHRIGRKPLQTYLVMTRTKRRQKPSTAPGIL